MIFLDLNKLCKLKSLVADNNEDLKVIPASMFDNLNFQIIGLHGYVYISYILTLCVFDIVSNCNVKACLIFS